jgi:hypothetical protein
MMARWASLKWALNVGQVFWAEGRSCQLRMSSANVVGRAMMIDPMLISWAVVSSLSVAEAMSACLAMAAKTLERGLVWS